MTGKKFLKIYFGVLLALFLVLGVVSRFGSPTSPSSRGDSNDLDLSTCVPERILRTPLDTDEQMVYCEDGRKFVIPMG